MEIQEENQSQTFNIEIAEVIKDEEGEETMF